MQCSQASYKKDRFINPLKELMTIVTKYIITPCLQLGQRQYTHLDAVLVVFSFS